MTPYHAPLRDTRFVLEELLEHTSLDLPGFEDTSPELLDAVLDEAARLAGEVWAPLNLPGDRQGCRRQPDGSVTVPDGFIEAYQAYAEGGWNGIGVAEAQGGQGLPEVAASAVQEMLHGANMALGLCPMLTAGAIEALSHHGSEALKARYLPKLIEGVWTGTMNLTEPQAGSDLSRVRTKAIPCADGEGDHYRLHGQKIYITWGEHEAAENIIHLVLARTPDAPEGNKGISLFLVPKFLVDDNGALGARNDVTCASIEHKLGIHGSPTCTLSFGEGEGAIGYLVGELGRGLNHMFTMMNEARHKVGIQGIGVAERATQQAFAYAAERSQGRAPGSRGGESAAIIDHFDVRRMLLSMRSRTDALRALALYCAAQMDVARHHGDAATRDAAQARVDVLIPVVKAFSTDQAVDIASQGIQVHGGMGYVEETGAAQLWRDARIAPIYEGTNGIQAMDLVGRKMMDGGEAANRLLDEIEADAETARDPFPRMADAVWQASETLREATEWMTAQKDMNERFAGAVPYLRAFARVLGGHLHLQAAMAEKAAGGSGAREKLARFYIQRLLPEHQGLLAHAQAGAEDLYALDVEDLRS